MECQNSNDEININRCHCEESYDKAIYNIFDKMLNKSCIILSFRRSHRLRNLISNSSNRFLPSLEMTKKIQSHFLLIVAFILVIASFSFAQDREKIDFKSCTFKDFPLNGKIEFVESFPDITVQIVESFPDLKVKIVNSFPDDCGEWQIVDSFPDVKIKIVESFPDIKIKFVESFPGQP